MSTMNATKDSELKNGIESVREPVVGVIKRKKKHKDDGQDAHPTRKSKSDPMQVKRVAKPRIKRGEHWNDNGLEIIAGRAVISCQDPVAIEKFLRSLKPSKDPLDRAHTHRRRIGEHAPTQIDESWVLLSHQEIDPPLSKIGRRTGKPKKTTPRLYPPSQLTSADVAFDSMYDASFDIAKELQGQGINLGWEMQTNREAPRNDHDRALTLAGLSCDEARAILRPRVGHHRTCLERKHERIGTQLLATVGFDEDAQRITLNKNEIPK